MSIQALREQRAAKCDALKELVDGTKNRAWTADDQTAYDNSIAEIEQIEGQIARQQKLNELAASSALNNSVLEGAERLGKDKKSPAAELFAKWLRGDEEAKNLSRADMAEHRAAFQNTMSTGTGSEGGFTVPTTTAATVLEALKAFGGVRAVAEILTTDSGNPMNFPASDGTSEKGRRVAENAAVTRADPSFSSISLPVYKYSSDSVAVPIELLQDSAIDIEGWLRSRLVTRLGRITNDEFTTGTGSSQPNGIVTAAASGKVGATGQTTTVTFDDLLDLEHSVDPAYRFSGENVGFMMADSSLKVLKKLKDSQNRPIFLPAYDLANMGQVQTVLGYPVTINQSMAAMAANAKSILFGALRKYVVRDAMGIQMFRFDDSGFMMNGQIGFVAFLRSGGNLLDVGGAVKYYQNSAS